jgi:hypothetical protein
MANGPRIAWQPFALAHVTSLNLIIRLTTAEPSDELYRDVLQEMSGDEPPRIALEVMAEIAETIGRATAGV